MMQKSLSNPVKITLAASVAVLLFCLPASTESKGSDAAKNPLADVMSGKTPVRSVGVDGNGRAVTEVPATDNVDEIQRFCGNIADAARDRRYAIQAKQLEELQADIDARMVALDAKRAEYETWMKKREAFLQQAQEDVVKMYSVMKPDAAAERLSELKSDLAAGILMKLGSRKAGTILNEMDSKSAATLTTIMASAVRREDPS